MAKFRFHAVVGLRDDGAVRPAAEFSDLAQCKGGVLSAQDNRQGSRRMSKAVPETFSGFRESVRDRFHDLLKPDLALLAQIERCEPHRVEVNIPAGLGDPGTRVQIAAVLDYKLGPMKLPTVLTFLALSIAARAEDLPPTLLTMRGKVLLKEDFSPPLAPVVGKPVGFASGFTGWRYNPGPAPSHGGVWTVAEGCFTGAESSDAHHPATASYGMDFKDVIIQCDVRLDDVPADGRPNRYIQIKPTDAKDYVCAVTLGLGGLSGRPFDDARINPATKQRMEGAAVYTAAPVKVGEWHTVVLEIKGSESVGTLDGKSITFSDPLIGADKHSIMLVAGAEGSFRHLRVWEALPNPDWEQNKAGMAKPAGH